MKKSILKYLLCFAILPLFASCNWQDLPSYDEAEISAVQFSYRWAGDRKDGLTGEPIVEEQRLTSNCTVDSANGLISVAIIVPDASGNFTEAVRASVSQSKLWAQATISTAARLSPMDGAAALGTPDDWTKDKKFVVKAANGKEKVWTVKVTSFTK